METKEAGRNFSIKHYVKRLLFISFIILILDLIISLVSISLVQQQSAQYLRNTAELYIDRINNNFSYLNHFMGWTLANDEDLELMNDETTSDAAFIKSNRNLFRRYAELQKSLGAEYNFFVYLKEKQFFSNFAPMDLTYPDYQAFKKQVIELVEDKMLYEQYYSEWTTIEINGSYYIINIVPFYDSYLISLISADKLISPLRELDLGGEGYATLIGSDGESITDPIPEQSKLLKLFQFGKTVNQPFSNATFHVKLVIQFGTFEKIMIAQLLVVLLAVTIACYLCFIMLYFLKKVLIPIKNFSKNLTVLTSTGEPIDFENSRIIELEKANKQFIDLVKQLKDIKIEMYERELEKQSMQLRYMKLQIKPHFFLNCLTTIYSMSQMHMHEEIQRMTMSISNYFRYIFQNDQEFVRLEDELEHIRVYFDIQRQRYQNAFTYQIVSTELTTNVRIPPLILQTFIENAMKYAVSRDKKVEISLEVSQQFIEGEELTMIRIADTGPGFPPDVLEKLRKGLPLDQSEGQHIGIMNTLQRLAYLYDNRAKVHFSNSTGGGACVVLYLPATEKGDLEHERIDCG